jgi:hypothetical protein
MSEDLERIVELTPAFDGRPPGLRMVLKGEKGAVQFVAYTDWYQPHVQQELAEKGERRYSSPLGIKPMGADVGYHSPHPMYEGDEPLTESCEYLDGRPCYYDGSGTKAQAFVTVLLKEGSDGIWKALEREYRRLFGDEDETR